MQFFGASSAITRVASRVSHLLVMTALVTPSILLAQSGLPNMDSSTLQRLQQQLGSGGGSSGGSGLYGQDGDIDSSRGGAERLDQDGSNGFSSQNGGSNNTPEELAIRRQRAEQQLERIYQPTAVEKLFRDRTGDNTLKQFGYNLFESSQAITGQVNGALSDNYTVGIGDELVVNFQGATNSRRAVKINREGQLVVDALPPIPAAGRPLAAVRGDIEAATRRTMLGTSVYTSVGAVRAITIYVGGEVNRPGQYQLTSLADVASALAKAGGVRRSGSLRSVNIIRGGRSISVDLYGLAGIGQSPSVRLSDGDRVVVPVIGDTIAIVGSVSRPAIYELRGKPSVGAVMDYAGGAIMPRGAKVSISRIEAGGRESFVPVTGLGQTVIAGDILQIFSGSGGVANRVELRGYVPSQGARPLQAAPTVRDLLGSSTDVRPGTYLPFALLIRRDPLTGGRAFEPVNLMAALTTTSVPLRSDDRLFVFSNEDIAFINSTSVREVVLGQRPSNDLTCPALDRLRDAIIESQETRYNVVTRSIYTRGDRILATGSYLATGGVKQGRERLVETAASTTAAGGNGQTANGQTQQQANSLNPLPTSLEAQDARDQKLREQTVRELMKYPDKRPCPQVFDEYPELLPIVIENAVSVGGGVRKPGAYPIAGAVPAAALAAIADGIAVPAHGVVLDVNRNSGMTPTSERFALDDNNQVLMRVTLRAGDDIRFNGSQPQYENSAVLLSGEFARPGLYTIRKGETLAELIARAGGLSPLAYPYGAVFTRASVRELQQEGYRRTARDLNNGLIAASARKTTSGDSIEAAGRLISQIANTEAVGRVVVEADPNVLAARHELDTVLEGGDAIFIPKQPNFVIVLGDIQNPGAVQFKPDQKVAQYVGDAGGTLQSADKKRVYIVMPNGQARPLRSSAWRQSALAIPPGSTVVVPKNLDPLAKLEALRDITGVFGSLVTSIATVAILASQ